jgi:hypothetical protein
VDNLLSMTETDDVTDTPVPDFKVVDQAVIDEAIRLIDTKLADLLHRELVSSDEVSDLLLDVRMLLTAADLASAADGPVVEPAPVA